MSNWRDDSRQRADRADYEASERAAGRRETHDYAAEREAMAEHLPGEKGARQ